MISPESPTTIKIAYIILAYKLPEQLIRLVNRLDTPDSAFFIHLDSRTDDAIFKRLKNEFKSKRNVFFLKRHASRWGRIGGIDAVLEGIKAIIESNQEFDYVVHLSGQDYPLKTNEEIQDFLASQRPKSIIQFYPIPYPDHPHIDEFFTYWHLYVFKWHIIFPKQNILSNSTLNRMWNTFAKSIKSRPKLPYGYRPYYGSAYWCLHRDSIEYIYRFLKTHKLYYNYFRFVQYPDESFFHILLVNSPLVDTLQNQRLVYLDFSSGNAHPAILTRSDLEKILSSNKFFARKFDTLIDGSILDLIDEKVIGNEC